MKSVLGPVLAAVSLLLVAATGVSSAAQNAAMGGTEDSQFDQALAAYEQRDYASAQRRLRPIAEQGHDRAQFNLGVLYDLGHGVPQGYSATASWYRKAAERGDVGAQNNLGSMYFSDEGVPQDFVQAHKWFNLAASRETDSSDREKWAKNRDRVAAKMTAAQIAEAQGQAAAWRVK